MKSLLLRLTLSIYIKKGRSHRSSNKNKTFCPTLHPETYITDEILMNMDHGLVTGSVFIDRAKVLTQVTVIFCLANLSIMVDAMKAFYG